MQFRLPENLQAQLIAYDPTLKKLAPKTNPTSKSTKPKFPLGQPYDLIPSDVIRESLVRDAIDNINSMPADNRFHVFKRIEGVLEQAKSVVTAIIYHYESCWYAYWLPPKGQEGSYVYGYSYAYKNTEAARKMLPFKVRENIDNCTTTMYGRSQFITYQTQVTKQDIQKWDSSTGGIAFACFSWKKGKMFREIHGKFKDTVAQTIPTWSDGGYGIFERIKDTSIGKIISDTSVRFCLENDKLKTWEPSFNSFFELITEAAIPGTKPYHTAYRAYNKILHIIAKPFFRKWIQSRCYESLRLFNDPSNNSRKAISTPWRQIEFALEFIYYVNEIWPDCPIDYYQNHINTALALNSFRTVSPDACEWLKDNMPVASFFQIISKHVESNAYQIERHGRIHFFEWYDTTSMLGSLLETGKTVEPPKRWRITEFHDHVQAESWKIKNTNVNLPQDLFPNPVRVQIEDKTWSFFQPHDLHQLASWGQAVRNCVGSAKHYADDVKKKKHFIVLALVDGKPTYTIQLEVDMGLMSVKQIAGVSNASLTSEERDAYTKAFGIALRQHEEELVSKS